MKIINVILYIIVILLLFVLFPKSANKFSSKKKIVNIAEFSKSGKRTSPYNHSFKESKTIKRKPAQSQMNKKIIIGENVLGKKILASYPFLAKGELVDEVVYETNEPDIKEKVTILKTSLKHPYLRIVEDYNNSTGDIISSQVMVANHIILTLNEGVSIESIKNDLEILGARIGAKRVYSKIYYIEFDIGDLKTDDKFIKVRDFLKTRDDILKSNPDRIFTIY